MPAVTVETTARAAGRATYRMFPKSTNTAYDPIFIARGEVMATELES